MALNDANTLNSGECGLTDGSVQGNWRLPNVRELQSLIDYGRYQPALPSGHPFIGVRSAYYWTSTTYAGSSSYAWRVGWTTAAWSTRQGEHPLRVAGAWRTMRLDDDLPAL